MAVAYVDSGEGHATGPSTTLPTANVTGTADATGILIWAHGCLDSSEADTFSPTVGGSATGVVALGGGPFSVAGGALYMQMFYKLNPGSGTLAIAGTVSASNENLFTVGACYTGVAQGGPVGTLATNSGNSGTATISPTGFVADAMIVAFGNLFGQTWTSTAGTEREQAYDAGADKTGVWGDRATDGALTWTHSSTIWGMVGITLLPDGGGANAVPVIVANLRNQGIL